MARTQLLSEMVANLRAEAGHSRDILQGVNTELTLKYILQRTQEELWTAFTWPELMLRDDRPMGAGLYLYDYSVNMKFDAIREAWAGQPGSNSWTLVGYGIGEDKLVPGSGLSTVNSDPVQLWETATDISGPTPVAKFRVWPTPTSSTWLRFKGNRELQPLVANSDRCTLDATLIILFSASELLARSKAEDAPNKLQKAQRHLTKLLGNQVSAKNKISTYGTASPGGYQRNGHTNIVAGYP